MGVMDSLGEEHANLVQQVTNWHTALQRRHTDSPSIIAFEEMGFDLQHVNAAYSSDTPPAGIFGVGVGHLGDRLRPVVFVLMELMTAPVEMPSIPSATLTPAQRLVSSYLNPDGFPPDLALIGLPRVTNFGKVFTGCPITVDTQRSSLGVSVTLSDGRRGYLTAGHGARGIGNHVLSGDLRIGSVVFSSSRENAPVAATVADVAAIALDTAVVEAPTGAPPITIVGNPSPQMLISMRRSGGFRRGRVWGLTPSFSPDSYASWGEAAVCTAISVAGDSGSAVLRDDNMSACIGQVVGGAENSVTIVQQMQYQLDAVRVTLRN
jgi:hypothetical protein